MHLIFENVFKKYENSETAVKGVTFQIAPGEFTAFAGPSGSGKTTLLNLAAGLDKVSQGKVLLLGKDLFTLPINRLNELRRKKVGFVFQSYNLFPVLTALENVEYPLALVGMPKKERRALARAALAETGCEKLEKRIPSKLSGGQQQRVSIARAIVAQPEIVFADEPTANLDSETAKKLLALFRQLNESKGITFLFSSHDPLVLNSAKRILRVADGLIQSDSLNTSTIVAAASGGRS